MKLIVKCVKCGQENKAPRQVNNRIDYAKQYGDNFTLQCAECDESVEYHVDDIKAVDYRFGELVKNKFVIFAIIFEATLILGFFSIGIAGGAVLSVLATLISMVLIRKNSAARNLTFNNRKLNGRESGVAFGR